MATDYVLGATVAWPSLTEEARLRLGGALGGARRVGRDKVRRRKGWAAREVTAARMGGGLGRRAEESREGAGVQTGAEEGRAR